MNSPPRLVIVGTGLAAVRAAEGARSAGWPGTIELLGEETHAPYDRPPLSKGVLASDDENISPPTLRSDEAWAAVEATIRPGVAATSLDTGRRVVHTSAGDVGYDRLVIATGSRPRTLPALVGVPNVHGLHRFEDAVALRTAMRAARTLLVIGAGFIGSEVASAAVSRGIDVTMVDAAGRPLERAIGPIAADRLSSLHRDAGVRTIFGAGIVGAEPGPSGSGVTVILDTGEQLIADAIVVGVGVTPQTAWLRDSGLPLDGPSGGLICDARMSAGTPGIWAAGDVACVEGHRSQHWTAAAEQGFVAGANAAGAIDRVAGVPFAWSTWHGHRIQVVGETVHATEVESEEGVIEYLDDEGVAVGAVGIDRPGDIARLRRRLTTLTKARQPTG